MSFYGPAYEFVAEVVRETDKALLCRIDGEEMWIPKTQIHEDSEVLHEEDVGLIMLSEWIARQKGLL